MVSTVAVTEPRRCDQALTLLWGVPVGVATMLAGSVPAPYRAAADVVFVLLIFGALYIRRFGRRATTLGVFAFQLLFATQFVGARVELLPQLIPAVPVGFGSSALVRFAVLRSPAERTAARLLGAFRFRLVLVLDALIKVAEGGPDAPRSVRAVEDLRRCTVRLHTGASMIRHRLGTSTPDACTAVIEARVAEAETAVERLAVLLMRVLWPGADIDTLTGTGRGSVPPRRPSTAATRPLCPR